MWFVYVLLCSDNSLYTGISPDPERRFADHIKGKGGAYTRSHTPVKMLYTEKLPSRSFALKREAEIKSWNKTKKLQLISGLT